MRVYTWNIPEIYRFPIYDRYIPGIFHIYDTIQIPDVGPGCSSAQTCAGLAQWTLACQCPGRGPGLNFGTLTVTVTGRVTVPVTSLNYRATPAGPRARAHRSTGSSRPAEAPATPRAHPAAGPGRRPAGGPAIPLIGARALWGRAAERRTRQPRALCRQPRPPPARRRGSDRSSSDEAARSQRRRSRRCLNL